MCFEGENTHYAGALCDFQALLSQYFNLATACWTACIAFTLYQAICNRRTDIASFEIPYHAFSWGLPLLTCIILIATKVTGPSGAWCWIEKMVKQRHGLFFFPFFVFF